MRMTPKTAAILAIYLRPVYDKAVKALGQDLGGFSALDLMADHFDDQPLALLREAMVIAGIPSRNI
jgi:hypothetical protein